MEKKKKTEGSHQSGALVQREDGGGEAPFSRSSFERLRDGRQPSATSQQGPHHKPQNLSVEAPNPVWVLLAPLNSWVRGSTGSLHCRLRVRAHSGVGDHDPSPRVLSL